MLWPIRRRLLAAAQVVCALALILGFILVVWSIADGPAVFRALGIETWLPAGELHDTSFTVVAPVWFIAMARFVRMIDHLRLDAISGDGDFLVRAKPLEANASRVYPAPITIKWIRSCASRIGLLLGCIVIVVCAAGLLAIMQQLGVFDFIASQDGLTFWLLTSGMVCLVLVFSLRALMLLYPAVQGPRGVVADEYGVSAWSRKGPRNTIAWTDARLLETWPRRFGVVVYRLYASDGRSVTWRCSIPHGATHGGASSEVDDHVNRTEAVIQLAAARAALTPRTFHADLADSADPSVKTPMNDVIPVGRKRFEQIITGMITVPIAFTAGYGLAMINVSSPLAPWASWTSAIALLIASLCSFALVLKRMLSVPTILTQAQRPNWQALAAGLGDRTVSTRSRSSGAERFGRGMRAALLLIGSVAGLATLVSSFIAGHPAADWLTEICGFVWLLGTVLFAILRLRGAMRSGVVHLTASAASLQTSTRTIPWEDITSLSFVSDKRGCAYIVETKHFPDIWWESGDTYGMTTDAMRDPANDGASRVDADTFAAIVAARTGLTPVQIVAW